MTLDAADWLARAWARASRWLEVGTAAAAARRADQPAPAPTATGGATPGEVTVLPIEDSLDLHHFRPRDVPSVVGAYLEGAHEQGLEEVRIIHGRGKGVQRSVVARLLAQHPLVLDFRPSVGAAGLGATVARLRPRRMPKTKTSSGF